MVELNFQVKDIDDMPLTFGKYKGETPNEIAEHDDQYICWLYENITNPRPVSRRLYLACNYEDAEIIERKLESSRDHF